MNMRLYEKNIVVKVNTLLNARIVKKIKAVSSERNPYVKRYGIKWEDPITFSHILAVVLYCDYTNLCTDFSSTFRQCKKYETLESIKNRNSFYYHFSKYLREAVEVYGQCSYGDRISGKRINKLSGPFYSGMSILLNIPAFNIRLCSPTSTSIQIEVAAKFSGPNGIIIMFNNPNSTHGYLRGFNVSWISRYKEEAERLWVGGYLYMKIESVKVKNTNNNYKKIIYSLAYLDSCITGGDVDVKKKK
eukprot:258721_1